MRYFFELVRVEKLFMNKRPIEEVAYELDYQHGLGRLSHMSDLNVVISIMDQLEKRKTLTYKQADYLRKSLAFNKIYHQLY